MGIHVIDEIMGRGKTSAMINYVNQTCGEKKYVFVTPYLKEVKRIMNACERGQFVEPSTNGRKLHEFKDYLREGRNIVSTHSLFKRFDNETLAMIQDQKYTLVMDEVISVIDSIDISTYDSEDILGKYAEVRKDGKLEWIADEYIGRFEGYKQSITSSNTFLYSKNHWVSMTPPEHFTSFEDVFVMTYMFDQQIQRAYFDFYGIDYDHLYINGASPDTYMISDTVEPFDTSRISGLIRVFNNEKMNRIGEERFSLSKSWFVREYHSEKMRQLRNNLYNFFRNYIGTPANMNLWTAFCDDRNKKSRMTYEWRAALSGGGYGKGFLPCTAKGTNEYRHKVALAYAINRFPPTVLKNFLLKNGIQLDPDLFALSEMLQWIWRSAIRDGKPIDIYVPSKRMRTLLVNWINAVSEGGDVYDCCKAARPA